MIKNSEIKKFLTEKLTPILEEFGMELVEIEIKKGNPSDLIVYIYKKEGVTIDDCTLVSGKINEIKELDDMFENSYNLQVSSPGLDRKLKTKDDYRRNLNNYMEIKLYSPQNGKKHLEGYLKSFDDENIYLEIEGNIEKIEIKNIALLRQTINFGGIK